jgi:ferric-dicitrate binding protein FerR (iron transport regulator)
MDPEWIEELINAAVDGEVDAADEAALADSVANDAESRALETSVRRQDALLRQAFAPGRLAAESLAERVIGSLAPAAAAPRVSQWWSWLTLLLAAAAGFLVAVILFKPWQKPGELALDRSGIPAAPPIAHLTVATGPVHVARADQHSPFLCPSGGPIESGANVSTGPQARCEFSTVDGSAVRLDADTKVKFDRPRAISMEQGELWSCVTRSTEPFAVKSSQGTVTSNEGKFDLSCKPGETLLKVVEGTAQLSAPAGDRTISAGHEIRIRNGAISDERAVEDLIFTTRWLHDLLALKGPGNPELQVRYQQMFAQIGAAKLGYIYEREIRAMGDASVLPLVYFLKDSTHDADQARRVVAARLLADLSAPRAIPELISLLSDGNGEVRFFIAQALARLTGETQGRTPNAWRTDPLESCETTHRDWQAWWQANKERYAGGSQ